MVDQTAELLPEDMLMTMSERERARRALTYECPDRAPRDLWGPPGLRMFRSKQLQQVVERFPLDFTGPEVSYGVGSQERGRHGVVGTYVDAWGCEWHVGEPGVTGEVRNFVLSDWSALERLRPPEEILTEADFSRVNAGCAATSKFVRAGTTIRPFERMQFLRGTENLMMDLAWGASQVLRLRDLLHEFYLWELGLWLETDVDGVGFMDDWGGQSSMLISPAMWREVFRPLYQEYCDRIHEAGKFAFFHSDGYIAPIIADLVEIGVDVLNAQLSCMDIEDIGSQFAGQIAFLTELDRQSVLPFGGPGDVRAAVRRLRAALEGPCGGVIAGCSWGNDVSQENVEAVFGTWDEPLAACAPQTSER
jgi:uroporphyrinogen decarboxylase